MAAISAATAATIALTATAASSAYSAYQANQQTKMAKKQQKLEMLQQAEQQQQIAQEKKQAQEERKGLLAGQRYQMGYDNSYSTSGTTPVGRSLTTGESTLGQEDKMGAWKQLSYYYLFNPDKLTPEMEQALNYKWQYNLTHKKKSSFGDKVKSVAKGLLTGNMIGISTGLVTNPKQTIQSAGSMVTGKTAGAASSGAALSTSMIPDTTETKKKTGLLTQLRQPKGAIGGGSYTETVKNPLGGSAGKTGKQYEEKRKADNQRLR